MLRLPVLVIFLSLIAAPQALPAEVTSDDDSAESWVARVNDALFGARALRGRGRIATRDHLGGGIDLAFDFIRWSDANSPVAPRLISAGASGARLRRTFAG